MNVAPQLACSLSPHDLRLYLSSPDWVIEQKLDGHRVMLMAGSDGKPIPITRDGNPYTKGLPTDVQNFRFPEPGWVLDGELVGSEYWVFDILHVTFEALAFEPLADRRLILEAFFAQVPNPFHLIPQARTTEEKSRLIETAVAHDLEGVVLKRADSIYHPGGRPTTWLKLKFTMTADVVVMSTHADGKESATLGIYVNGSLSEIGKCSLIGKPAVSPGNVVEVKYLYVGANGRLYQPTLVRPRPDKKPLDCDGSDFKHVNKEVLAAI